MRLGKWIFFSVSFVVLAYAWYWFSTPPAVRAYHWKRHLLEQEVQMRSANADGVQHEVSSEALRNAGFISFRKERKCTSFYHQGFMAAIDDWHEIVHSPDGRSGLPNYFIGERNTLSHLQCISRDGCWYYVCHD